MPGLVIHRSNRTERLVWLLAKALERPRGGPLDPEPVVVHGRGMATWLSMQLSRALGIWAGPLFYPETFIDILLRRALGPEAPKSRWISEQALAFAVEAVLPDLLGRQEFSSLAHYLGDDPVRGQSSALAAKLGGMFSRLLVYRPDWIRAWEAGDPAGIPESLGWQPILWRAIASRIDRPHLGRLEHQVLDELRKLDATSNLPSRVSLFGVSTLPPVWVRILCALAHHSEVHLYRFSAGPWSGPLTPRSEPGLARAGTKAALGPLLSARERVETEFDAVLVDSASELGVPLVLDDQYLQPEPSSVLSALQARLFAADEHRPNPAPTDASLRVHVCHGPLRELEVLRDQLLELMTRAKDPIAPEEVAVLVPELRTYAPLVDAVFGGDPDQPGFIPFHVADRSAAADLELAKALDRLLSLVGQRTTSSRVFSLLEMAPIRRRFEIAEADLPRLKRWTEEARIRWGMDADEHRSEGRPEPDRHSFDLGLKRLMLGYAMPAGEPSWFEGVLPCPAVEGKDAELLGRYAHFCRTLFLWLRRLTEARPMRSWLGRLDAVLAALFDVDSSRSGELSVLREALSRLAEAAHEAGFEGPVHAEPLRRLLTNALGENRPERGFLAGGVTFCAVLPMRSMPFRVIALVGMNDAAFPRPEQAPGFDPLRAGQAARRVGDRDQRDDDRYVFLETLCAARDRLIVTYSGRSPRDNSERPASVCVNDLLDALEQDLDLRRHEVMVEHHLQGHHPSYFDGSDPRRFSYSDEQARAARALLASGEPSAPPSSEPSHLAPEPARLELSLQDLFRFFRSPPAHYLRQKLAVTLSVEQEMVLDREPLGLAPLERHDLGEAVLDALLDPKNHPDLEARLRAEGRLPAGEWGSLLLDELTSICLPIAGATQKVLVQPHLESDWLDIELPDAHIFGPASVKGQSRVDFSFSRVLGFRRLRGWIRHLLWCASGHPEPSFVIGRGAGNAEVVELSPVEASRARSLLYDLVQVYREGQTRPLPFLPEPSYQYAARCFGRTNEAGRDPCGHALRTVAFAYSNPALPQPEDPAAKKLFCRLPPPFDPVYEAGRRSARDTDFSRLACAVFEPMLRELEQ